ncbi:MAG: UDP-N-acetylmuramate: L-alanyl-gamma-D-glutamyl-meso-diaminopimelate ligase [Gammaproteobacteria bacterium]|jgi:UDP-N-acetylmuramate: L-alanyl-gamma-D-glutamyl-meso-diaminopimelate ligase
MAGIAELALQLGHTVSGSDASVYPPMSTFLEQRGINIFEGYDTEQFDQRPDLVLIGNALSRGNEAVEYVLNQHIRYQSGAQWIAHEVLRTRHVIAVSGTHGKTTTTSILTWILDQCGLEPGYLIGGIAKNFPLPASLGGGKFFVIEADEYDTAFFDKRSKFVHYQPDTLIINNLEFDHADIFPDLEAIQRQFSHLLRIVPSHGLIISPESDGAIAAVMNQGCWSRRQTFGLEPAGDWQICKIEQAGSTSFQLQHTGHDTVAVRSALLGEHNAFNVTAAICAAVDVGVSLAQAVDTLPSFGGVKRRLEVIGCVNGVTVYDDFAHHPTAIQATLTALRASVGGKRIICILEPRSNTMRLGVHAAAIGAALANADKVFVYADKSLSWDPATLFTGTDRDGEILSSVDQIIDAVAPYAAPDDHIVIMSNGGFDGIHAKLLETLG